MRHSFHRLALSLCVISAIAFVASTAGAQTSTSQATGSSTVTTTSQTPELTINFTSKLMGYFRLPDHQPWAVTNAGHCMPPPEQRLPPGQGLTRQLSHDAQVFTEKFRSNNALLVGTGDNFSPNYFSRVLVGIPPELAAKENGKDFFGWDGTQWVPFEKAPFRHNNDVAPADNVACFLAYEHYAAVVPGKHDLHYGPERLRELARFMAGIQPDSDFQPVQMLAANMMIKTTWAKDHEPVSDSGKPRLSYDVKFIPRQLATSQKGAYSSLEISDFTDGGFAFPWMRSIRVTAKSPTPDKESPQPPQWPVLVLCKTFDFAAGQSDPDAFLERDITDWDKAKFDPRKFCNEERVLEPDYAATLVIRKDDCLALDDAGKRGRCLKSDDVAKQADMLKMDAPLQFVFGVGDEQLQPGASYAVCAIHPEVWKKGEKFAGDSRPYCFRFGVYTPFFEYASNSGQPKPPARAGMPQRYVIKTVNGVKVAIFGVVDPQLLEHVGGNNAAWQTVDSQEQPTKYSTKIAMADPALALIQLQDFFERKYAADNPAAPVFQGVRLLLAQMPPEQAKELAEHLPRCARFDVVVSAADDVLASPNQVVDIQTDPPNEGYACGSADGSWARKFPAVDAKAVGGIASPPTFIAVPPSHEKAMVDGSRFVNLRTLKVSTDETTQWKFALSGTPVSVQVVTPGDKTDEAAKLFWASICSAVYTYDYKAKCGGAAKQALYFDSVTALQQLTLAAIQSVYSTDAALLQSRDFYTGGLVEYLTEHCKTNSDYSDQSIDCGDPHVERLIDLQEVLDRIVWKGDLIRVRPVKGMVLQTILKESANYAKAEKTAYLPVSETGRALVTIGIEPDNKNGGDYLLNGKPVDPNSLYAIATSDYIALGDTGYPELATPPVGDPPQPASPHGKLVEISTTACRSITSQSALQLQSGVCRSTSFPASKYYDEIVRKPEDPRKGNTAIHKLYAWSFFHGALGQDVGDCDHPVPTSGADSVKQRAQCDLNEKPNWDFALTKFSLGFAGLSHNGSEQTLSQNFGGVLNSQVLAKHFHSWDWEGDSRFTRYYRNLDLFVAETLQYSSNFVSQVSGPRSETQSNNLFAIDGGTYLHPLSFYGKTKKLPQASLVLSGHFETQVGNPIVNLNLNPIPPSTMSSTLSYFQGRTKLLLGRTGVRFQDRKSYVEAGLEGGQTLNAIRQFNVLSSAGVPVPCMLEASVSLTKCINNYNMLNPAAPITPASQVTVLRSAQDRYGAYWLMGLNVPLATKVSYNFQDTSDYFFLSSGDNSTDTRFRHQLVNSVKFAVWQNLSFEPTYKIFLFENKVDYHFLFQQQYGVNITYSFDVSNKHEAGKELQYKPPSAQ